MNKTTLLYDQECDFCKRQVKKWKKRTGDKVDYLPYQTHSQEFPQVSKEQCRQSVQLITANGKTHQGAKTIFTIFKISDHLPWLYWCYQHIPFFAQISEKTTY